MRSTACLTLLFSVVQAIHAQERNLSERMVSDLDYSKHAVIVTCKQQIHIMRFSNSKYVTAEVKKGVMNGIDDVVVSYEVQTYEEGKEVHSRKGRFARRTKWKDNNGKTEEDVSQIKFPCGTIWWTSRDETRGYIYFFSDEMDVMVVYGDFEADKVLPRLLKKLQK